MPVIIELMDWGARYNADCPRRELGRKILKNKAAVMRILRRQLEERLGSAPSTSGSPTGS